MQGREAKTMSTEKDNNLFKAKVESGSNKID